MKLYERLKNGLFPICLVSLLAVPLLPASCSCEKQEMTVDKVVLLYLAANNNLSGYAAQNVSTVRNGYLPGYYTEGEGDVFLLYSHISGSAPCLTRLSRNSRGEPVTDTLMCYPGHNSCDPGVLKTVMDDAFGRYPSKERGLILWSHGTGWLPEGYYSDPVEYSSVRPGTVSGQTGDTETALVHIPLPEDPYAYMVKSFGSDDDTDSEMDMVEMADALEGFGLDYIIFDCCLMGGVEVAYQVRDVCDYVVFSQAEILAYGFPYESLLRTLFSDGMTVEAAMLQVGREYYEYYEDESATVSVVKTDGLESVAAAVKAVMDGGGRERTGDIKVNAAGEIESIQRYFRYRRHWFYDLDDYISTVCDDGALYTDFSASLSSAVIYKAATPYVLLSYGGFEITHHSGLSTYINRPESVYLNNYYRTLDWCAASGMLN